ncbi:MAG: SDR family oxidoreductase [Actinomycetota bacterium]|nr:SDR family oxidoreductase [Actinomycetota bacterium]
MTSPAGNILVTGGTGLVGHAIVEAFDGASVLSLTRHGAAGWHERTPEGNRSASGLLPDRHGHVVTAAGGVDNVVYIQGDVTQPRLGLTDAKYAELAGRVDAIVHSAGVSDFTTPKRAVEALNVEGTRNIIDLAQRADVPLYHISSAYVHADGTSVKGRWGAAVYLESKRAAERLLEDSGVPAAIIRPSVVFGDSRTGYSPSFQGLHRLIGMMLKEQMPLLPFSPETRVDFLPRDVVGAVTARLVRDGFRGEFWLSAGPDALSFGRVVELLIEYGESLGLKLEPPRFVDRDMIERLIKPAGGETVARRIDVLLALTSHFESRPSLRSSLEPSERPDLEAAFMLGARYWGEKNGVASGVGVAA